MTEQMRFTGSVLMVVGLALAALIFFAAGCEKQQPTAQQVTQTPAGQAKVTAAATEPANVRTVAAEQTTCPVMGGAINKAIFVEYQGKKVYFCCGGCPDAFKANPEKYIAKLPQFQK